MASQEMRRQNAGASPTRRGQRPAPQRHAQGIRPTHLTQRFSPARTAISTLLSAVLVSAACATRPPDLFSEVSARMIADSLANIPPGRVDAVAEADFCALLEAWKPGDPDPPKVQSVGEHVARYLRAHAGFSSCTVRSMTHIQRFPALMRIDDAHDIVVWRDGSDPELGTLFVGVVHDRVGAGIAGVGDLEGVWPVAVALEAIRAFVNAPGRGHRIVVTVADLSQWSGDRVTTWLDSLSAQGPYSSRLTVRSRMGPAAPTNMPIAPGWVAGWISADPGRSLVSRGQNPPGIAAPRRTPIVPDLTSPNAAQTNPVSFQALGSERWLAGEQVRNSAIAQSGNKLVQLLRSAGASTEGRLVVRTISGHGYWLAGILFPILFAVVAVMKITIRSATRLSNVKRAIDKLEGWIKRARKVTKTAELASAPLPKLKRAWARVRLFLAVHILRWKHLDSEVRKAKCDDLAYLRKRKAELERDRGEREGSDVKSLFAGMMSGVSVVSSKGGAQSFIVGILTSIAAFVVVHVLDTTTASFVNNGYNWGVIVRGSIVAAIVYVIGYVLGARSNALAFAWGFCLSVFVGINTVELSDRFRISEIHELYDSQTVAMVFLGVAMLLTVCRIMKKRGRADREEERERAVVKQTIWLAASGGWRERVFKGLLVVLYAGLVIHLVFPAVLRMMETEHWLEGLLPITAVTLASLVLPVLILFLPRRGKSQSDEASRGGCLAKATAVTLVAGCLTGGCTGQWAPPTRANDELVSLRIDMRDRARGHLAYWLNQDGQVAEVEPLDTTSILPPPMDRRDSVLSVTDKRRTLGIALRDTTGAEMVAVWSHDSTVRINRVGALEVEGPDTLRAVERWLNPADPEALSIEMELERCIAAELSAVRRFGGRKALELVGPFLGNRVVRDRGFYLEVVSRVMQDGPLPPCCRTGRQR